MAGEVEAAQRGRLVALEVEREQVDLRDARLVEHRRQRATLRLERIGALGRPREGDLDPGPVGGRVAARSRPRPTSDRRRASRWARRPAPGATSAQQKTRLWGRSRLAAAASSGTASTSTPFQPRKRSRKYVLLCRYPSFAPASTKNPGLPAKSSSSLRSSRRPAGREAGCPRVVRAADVCGGAGRGPRHQHQDHARRHDPGALGEERRAEGKGQTIGRTCRPDDTAHATGTPPGFPESRHRGTQTGVPRWRHAYRRSSPSRSDGAARTLRRHRSSVGPPTAAAGLRRNLAIALAVAALHAGAALAYHGDGQDLPATYFYPRAHAIGHGTDAYGGLDYEYPPATLPLLEAPLAAGGDDSGQAYHQRTIWLYGALDVVCVLLLGSFCAAGPPSSSRWRSRSTASACSYSGRLALTRFDLAAGIAILLAGRCARSPGRAGAWLGLAGALKLVPLAAAPAMTRRGTSAAAAGRRGGRPDRGQVAYSLWSGEVGLSWIGYHAGRDPEIESWAAVLADLARGLGAHAGTAFDHGSQNVTGTTARWLGRIFALASIALRSCWHGACGPPTPTGRSRCWRPSACSSRCRPVLSPQYLLWLAPLSALLAPRYPLQAALLAVASVLTRARAALCVRRPAPLRVGRDRARRVRNAVLVAFAIVLWRSVTGYWASERKTDQAGLAFPFVNERPVWKPGRERLAHLLVADQEPDQHVDARIRARRGDVAAQLLRLIGEAHALEPVRRIRLQPELGDPELQALAREGRVEPLDQARQVGERDVVRLRAAARPSCRRPCGTDGGSRRRAAGGACRAAAGSAAARRRARTSSGPSSSASSRRRRRSR